MLGRKCDRGVWIVKIVNLDEAQLEMVENKLSDFDERYITYKMDGNIQIGIEEDGNVVAGLDACVTAFKILYVSTVFVDEAYRRKGYGKLLMEEMEKRAREMGVNTIRLDTFSWQGKEFYEAVKRIFAIRESNKVGFLLHCS